MNGKITIWTMIGVFINCIAVIIGALLGILFGKKLNETFKNIVFVSSGLITIVMGIQMALCSSNFLVLLISLMIGGFVGYALKIEDRILVLGEKIAKNGNGDSKNFALGFMNASVLFCSGAMAVVGSIQASTTGDLSTILIKSVLDFCMAIVLASVYGIGVMFSCLFVAIYQGFFTLAGSFIEPVLGQIGIDELSAAGGLLLMMIGLNFLKIKEFKTGNFLPALVFAPVFALLVERFF